MIEEQNMLLFGNPKEQELHFIYARYAMGDPVSMIAADLGISEAKVHARMRTQPEKYEEIKKQRQAFTGLRIQRSLSLIDAYRLCQLEKLTEDQLELDLLPEIIKQLSKWTKELAHRLQLHEGKATEIAGTDEKLTREQVLQIMKQQEEAGDALCTEL